MLFLGMCLSLRSIYKVTSNLETEHERNDIRMESLSKEHLHIIKEFKQGEKVDKLK